MSSILAKFDKNEILSWVKTPLPLFALAHFSHDMALSLLVPLLPFIRADFGLNYLQAGLLVSAYAVTSGFAQLPMGWVADRLGPKRMIAAGLSGVGIATISISLTRDFHQMLPILVIMGLLAGAYHPSVTSYLPLYFPPEKRGRAIGYHLVGGSCGYMLGPFLGGIIAAVAGWRSVFLILSLPAIFTALLLLRTTGKEPVRKEDAGAAGFNLSIWKTLQGIALILAVAVVAQLIGGAAVNYVPIYFVDRHSIDPAHAAMWLGLLRFGSVVSGPLGGIMTDRLGIKSTVLLSVCGAGPALFLIAILPFNAFAMVPVLFLMGIFNMVRQPAMQSLIVNVSSQRHRSTLLGFYFFLGMEGMSLMLPLAGFSMDAFGLFPTFLGMSIAALILSIVTISIQSRL